MILLATALALAGCDGVTITSGPGDPPPPIGGPGPAPIELVDFGFAAVDCGLDDPNDDGDKTFYGDEVAGFSNLNQVCVTGDVAVDAERLARSIGRYRPLLYVEPVFFEDGVIRRSADYEFLWDGVTEAIRRSGIAPDEVDFYLADEPQLRGVSPASLRVAAERIRRDYPDASLTIIEGYLGQRDPQLPEYVTRWGFNAYAVPDPAGEPLYVEFLDRAASQLRDGQSLVLVGDGIHTRFHEEAGLSEADMAKVARNYAALAQARDDVSALLVYSWPGGVDPGEKGVRNLPAEVENAWREVGAAIAR